MSLPLLTEMERRESIADRTHELFVAHPGEWISLTDLVRAFGSAVTVRIRLDLRKTRGLNIHWNKQNGAQSAYRYLPHVPIGPEASEPMREVTLFNQSDRHEGR